MSANSSPEQATGSDTEIPEFKCHGKLNDPTGQYASAYARAGKAKQISSSPTLDQQTDRQGRRDSRSRVHSPTLESILASGLPCRQIERERRQSRNPPSQLPRHQEQERDRLHYRTSLDAPSQDVMDYQAPAVARVIDRQPAPYQYSTAAFDSGVHSSTSRPQHYLASPQYNISELEQSPLAPAQSSHRLGSVPHSNINGFDNSLPQTLSNRSSHRLRSTSVQHEDIEYGVRGSSRELVPYHSDYAEEGRAMTSQAQPTGMGSPETVDEDDDSGLFVPSGRNRSFRVKKSGTRSRHRFSHDIFVELDNRRQCPQPVPDQLPPDEYYNNPGKALAQSRYAGGENNWGINAPPVLVPQEQVTDAALLKRGLKRGKEAKVCKRGYGANDPENIAIVNMYEKDGMSFEQIKNKLNADRVKTGRNPSLSANGVHSRYNRTAPLLFGAEGKVFVPLSQRGGRGQPCAEIPTGKPAWNDNLDTALVLVVKEWEKTKWENVAKMFKEKTGVDMEPEACAVRHHMI